MTSPAFITARIANADDNDTIIANMNEVLSKNAHWLQEKCDMYDNDPQKILDARNDVYADVAMGQKLGDLSLVHLMDAIIAWCMYKTANDQSWLFVVIQQLIKAQSAIAFARGSNDDDDSSDDEYMSQVQFDAAMSSVGEDYAALLQ
tara:strand:+ start:341 stop:781 length:441 start_codon:yes stop_codon:yes gene_type:complete